MKAFDLLVLNENFEIVALLNYTTLQWRRRYYESGTFSVEIPLGTYSSDFKYLYTKDRPELGVIEQINYYINDTYKSVNLSGYFLENELNRRVVYKKGDTTNISNAPSWVIQSGKAEDVATNFFNAFKDVTVGSNTYALGIAAVTSQSRGKTSEHTRGNEYLGNKCFTILKPSKMSYRVSYNFTTSEKSFSVWSGLDRSSGNTAGNNPVVFSTLYGNLKNVDLLLDVTSYKNAYMVTKDGSNNEGSYTEAGVEAESGEVVNFLNVSASSQAGDYDTTAEYIAALQSEGHEALLDKGKTVSLDFDTIEGSYEYMTDFDLGDICSIEVADLGISVDAVLTGIDEVVKKGVPSITLEFTID